MQALPSTSGNMETINRAPFNEVAEQWLIKIYKQEFVRLHRYAIRIVHNKMEAEEIVAQGFVKLFGQLCDNSNKFSSPAHAKAYLLRVISNSCCSWLRQRRSFTVCEPAESIMDDHHLVLELERQDLLQHLLHLIDQLPTQLQQVAILYFKEGLSSEEIEQRLHLNKGVLRVYRSRVIKKLREMMCNERGAVRLNQIKYSGTINMLDEKFSTRPVSNLL